MDTNSLYVFLSIRDIGWYLLVIGKLNNAKTLLYIFTGEVIDVTPNVFSEKQYDSWF